MNFQELAKQVISEVNNGKIRLASDKAYPKIETDEYGTNTVEFSGGLNGTGKWNHYLDTLGELVRHFDMYGYKLWVIYIKNDPLDDIFYAKFGYRRKEIDD